MKAYNPEKNYKSRWLARQEYVHCSDAAAESSIINLLYDIVEKYPIEKIKHDKENYPNSIDMTQVIYMSNNFYPNAFDPIVISQNSELKDGQHRLELAKMFGWKYIDVFVEKIHNK
ncbi:MAG: hypothetical protein LBQ28_10280 [Prevotellaceae bacterium]|jgi:hypothetical protein|nr:hypothetical protein [Prevotellaceae bacterium]